MNRIEHEYEDQWSPFIIGSTKRTFGNNFLTHVSMKTWFFFKKVWKLIKFHYHQNRLQLCVNSIYRFASWMLDTLHAQFTQ